MIVVAGDDVDSAVAERLACAVAQGTPLIALSPQPTLAAKFGLRVGANVPDTHVVVEDMAGGA